MRDGPIISKFGNKSKKQSRYKKWESMNVKNLSHKLQEEEEEK